MSDVIDDRAPKTGLPLPHPDNDLGADVLRLRQALGSIDTLLAAAQAALQLKSDADGVARLAQRLTDADAALQTQISQLAAQKVQQVNGKPGPDVTLAPADLGMVPNRPTDGASAATLARDAQGRISKVSYTLQGKAGQAALAYDAQGRVASVQTTWDGQAATVALARDAAGLLTGFTRS